MGVPVGPSGPFSSVIHIRTLFSTPHPYTHSVLIMYLFHSTFIHSPALS